MLAQYPPAELSPEDQALFDERVRPEHYLRQVMRHLDFSFVRQQVAECYSPDLGRPAVDPVLALKLQFLQFRYGLSDVEVIEQAEVNLAFRLFLGLGRKDTLPDASTLAVFRRRLGETRYERIFQDIVQQAREQGLIQDRLRLKDATHVLANIAVPSALRTAAEIRDLLLAALQPLAPERVGQEQQEAQRIRLRTQDLPVAQRLAERVKHLRAIREWAWPLAEAQEQQPLPQELAGALALLDKFLNDQEPKESKEPEEPEPSPAASEAADGPLLSVHDPDARRGKHGHYFNGYLLDVLADADSQIVTAVNVLAGNADEAADVRTLIEQEQGAQGNKVAALSIDAIGFNGPRLREWTDPEGMALEVYVPPKPCQEPAGILGADAFKHDAHARTLTCPAGHQASEPRRSKRDYAWVYYFSARACRECPLRQECLTHPEARGGRQITVNDYRKEYAAARAKAQTPEYAAVRAIHPCIERKIGELARHGRARLARYRGLVKVRIQAFVTALVVNVSRMVQLLQARAQASASELACA